MTVVDEDSRAGTTSDAEGHVKDGTVEAKGRMFKRPVDVDSHQVLQDRAVKSFSSGSSHFPVASVDRLHVVVSLARL